MHQDMPLVTVFQPIVNLVDGCVLGYEALGRMSGWEEEGFHPVLEWAKATQRTTAVYRQLLLLAFETARDRPGGTFLFVNGRLGDLRHLGRRKESWSEVVIEVPESDRRLAQWDAGLRELRHRGLQVAIDDWGIGRADPLRLIQLEPEWVKIDVALTRQIQHPQVARLVELLVRWVSPKTHIVAEGIETIRQLEALRQLGVTYGQGFALARPGHEWETHITLPGASPRTAALQLMPLALGQANRLSEEDLAVVEMSHAMLRPLFREALEEFLEWLYTTPMMSRFVGLDRKHHERILMEHFELLTRGSLNQGDVDRAERIARVHQRYGIDLSYYVTGYRQIQAYVARTLRARRETKTADAMRHLFDWDMSVVLHAYQDLLDHDTLTGTLTRQAFWDRVEHDLFLATTTNRAAALVILDVKGLKDINHHSGHIVGDRVISHAGSILRDFSTSSYLVGRIGGDLFALWTQHREPRFIQRDLDSLANRLALSNPQLMFSSGIAVLGRHGTTLEALYAHADQELYRQRRATIASK